MELTKKQVSRLATSLAELGGPSLSLLDFADLASSVLDDIAGLEVRSDGLSQSLINQLWKCYMTEKQAELRTPALPTDSKLYKQAIDEGKKVIAEGGTKAAAARAVFNLLFQEHREVVIAAFKEAAGVTEKGAPTYYYNVSRQHVKAEREAKRKSKPS
jgi:hypothetical protein